jgi:hypothetical protein
MWNALRWLLPLLIWALPSRAQNEELWITDLSGLDSVTVQVGEVVELQVNIRTNSTRISGFQCFMSFAEDLAVPVRYNDSSTGWFANTNLFPGSVIFADDHDSRLTPLPGNQLDWCYQTGISIPRPTYTANGVACRFKLRFLRPVENYLIHFDHDNNHFRNTLYWEGQSAVEHAFWRERPLVVTVVGIRLGPLPDLYLTTPAPCDSLNLYDYVDLLEGTQFADYLFNWQVLDDPSVCSIDSQRTADAFWLRFCGEGPGRSTQVRVCASVLGLSICDTLSVLRGDPPVVADTLQQADPFIAWAEDDSTSFGLDGYVSDLDDPVEDLVWSLVPGSYTVDLRIEPDTRVARLRSPPDWSGRDTLRLRVVDPGGMADTARVITWTWPVNDPPELDFGPRLELHPGQPRVIDLETVTVDIDNSYDELFWTLDGDTSQVTAHLDQAGRRLTLAVRPETPLWTEAAFIVHVYDLEGLSDLDTLDVLVSTYPPLWQPLDEILLPLGTVATRPLFNFVSDQDNADSELELWATGQSRVQVEIQPGTGIASFSVEGYWTGIERIALWAEDPDGNMDSTQVAVYSLQGGNPLVVEIPDLVMLPGAVDSLRLDRHVRDLDTPVNQLLWNVLHAGLFQVVVQPQTRIALITAPMQPGTVDLATWRATDPEGQWGEDVGALAVIDPSGLPLVLPIEAVWMRTASVDTSVFLDALVYDYNHLPAEMSWSVQQGVLVSTQVLPDRRLRLSSGWQPGVETLALTVTDPDQNQAHGALVVHVSEGQPPVVSAFPPRFLIAGQTDTLRALSTYVYDPDPGDEITWSFVLPLESPLQMLPLPALDAAVIRSHATHTGLDRIGAVASDREQNTAMAWIDVRSLENQPPRLAAAVWPNPGLPAQLDVVVAADEPLRSLSGWQRSDGAPLAFAELTVAQPRLHLFRSDWQAPMGSETLYLRAVDLPGFPQVAGNTTLDSLVLSSGLLSGPGEGFAAPGGGLRLSWIGGAARWLVEEPAVGPSGGPWLGGWRVVGAAGGLAQALREGGLEVWQGGEWRSLDQSAPLQGETWLRPAGETDAQAVLPTSLRLAEPWPNPFNPVTQIAFDLPESGPVRLEVVDLLGRITRRLLAGPLEAGRHRLSWDGRDEIGRPVASGVYFLRLLSRDEQRVAKLILLR